MWPSLSGFKFLNPFGAETRIFFVNYVSVIAADALAPCVTRSSAPMNSWLNDEHEVQFMTCKVWYWSSLWPGNVIWWHRSGSALAQVMACCLRAPSHYLDQCSLIISKVQRHSSEGNFAKNLQPSTTKISLKITLVEFLWNLLGDNELIFHILAPAPEGFSFHNHLKEG